MSFSGGSLESYPVMLILDLIKKLSDKMLIFLSHNSSLSKYFDKELNLKDYNKL